MNPEEVCSLIDTLRETVMKIMDVIIDSRDEHPVSIVDLSEELQGLHLGYIRIICLLLSEDTTIPPERVAKLVPIFSDALALKSCYGLHHIIFTGLTCYQDHEEVVESINFVKEAFLSVVEQCQECHDGSALCHSFRDCLLNKK